MTKKIATICLAALLLLTLGCASKSADKSAAAPEAQAERAPATTSMPAEMPAMEPMYEYDAYAPLPEPMPDAPHNTEEYSSVRENRFLSVATSPFSTFAADVDTASYANIRRMLLDGERAEPDAVRIEEMINYFHYDYPEPDAGAPFSVTTELAPCPWNPDTELLLIGLQAASVETASLPASNLVFLIDVSGSMDTPDKLPLVKRAFQLLTENLRPEDTVSIVTYASADRVVLDGADGTEKADIMAAIENLTAGGSTAGADGIETAYALAEKHFRNGGNNRIILATDGDLNVGVSSEGALTRLVERKRRTGVFLSVMGFGTGNLKDNKLEALADNGNGNYSYIDSIAEARKVLIDEMGGTLVTVAKDVKLQVEFNPAAVKGYRLIGYENRLMNAEDFADDTKDGGEIGAGHRVTALYEVVRVGSPFAVDGVESKYQAGTAAADDSEWLTVSIRYKDPDGDTSRLLQYPVDARMYADSMSDNLRLASAIAAFGMLLTESEHAGTATFSGVKAQLAELPSARIDDYVTELAYLITRAAQTN